LPSCLCESLHTSSNGPGGTSQAITTPTTFPAFIGKVCRTRWGIHQSSLTEPFGPHPAWRRPCLRTIPLVANRRTVATVDIIGNSARNGLWLDPLDKGAIRQLSLKQFAHRSGTAGNAAPANRLRHVKKQLFLGMPSQQLSASGSARLTRSPSTHGAPRRTSASSEGDRLAGAPCSRGHRQHTAVMSKPWLDSSNRRPATAPVSVSASPTGRRPDSVLEADPGLLANPSPDVAHYPAGNRDPTTSAAVLFGDIAWSPPHRPRLGTPRCLPAAFWKGIPGLKTAGQGRNRVRYKLSLLLLMLAEAHRCKKFKSILRQREPLRECPSLSLASISM